MEINNQEELLIVRWNDKLWNVRIITEYEAFALMGFDKSYIDKLYANGVLRSTMYKVAGNSIVVNVLEAIFKELLKEYK